MTFPDFSTPGAGQDPESGPAHARVLSRAGGTSRVVALAVTAVLVLGVAGAWAAVARWGMNIDRASTSGLTNRPEKVIPDPSEGEPVNLLVMGSDSREGENGNIGGTTSGGQRSDTTILLHVSADRSRIEAISIPRDSTVEIPSCVTTGGESTAPSYGKFNGAFAIGASVGGDTASGALCAMQTVEALTGVYLDGFVVIDFQGFQRMIDAVGGVEICVEEEIYAPKANDLHLTAGLHTLDGSTALDFARARYGVGDGSDTSRIGRQQELLASLVRTVFSAETLADPAKTLRFVDAVTSSMTMDEQTARIDYLTGLAYSLRGLRPETVTFVTVPWGSDPYNSSNVVWTDEAALLWENIQQDRPVGHDPAAASTAPAAAEGEQGDVAGTSAESGASDAPTTPAGENIDSTASASADDVKEPGKEAFTGADTTAVCG
ncbi:LCP family protein [Myceligenerans crystallogenes]|uniref:LCP family protein n=1 Tax=Myceligenerans crystallogenes TaxID=316335 RepID=A0ABN2NCP6_9MICO